MRVGGSGTVPRAYPMDAALLGAVYRNNHLTGELRKRALERVKGINCGDWTFHDNAANVSELWHTHWTCTRKIYVDDCLYLDLDKVVEAVGPRVDLYMDGLKKIEEKSAILAGEPVYKGTRLSVFHIGKMLDRGESIENILKDYPYLEKDDVRFAHLYYRAHPAVGRPRTTAEADDVAEIDAG